MRAIFESIFPNTPLSSRIYPSVWVFNKVSYTPPRDICESLRYSPLVNRPTRVTSTSATIIDNIFTNNHDATVDAFQGILVTDISDHFPIFHIGTINKKEPVDRFIVKRSFDEKNKNSFLENIGKIDWNSFISSGHAQTSFSEFHKKYVEIT